MQPGDPDFELMEDLTTGLYDEPSPDKPIEFIETTLENRRKQRKERQEEKKMDIVRAVSAKHA